MLLLGHAEMQIQVGRAAHLFQGFDPALQLQHGFCQGMGIIRRGAHADRLRDSLFEFRFAGFHILRLPQWPCRFSDEWHLLKAKQKALTTENTENTGVRALSLR